MRKFNLALCQELLKQTNSIDETARLMSDYNDSNRHHGFHHWRNEIIKEINRGALVL